MTTKKQQASLANRFRFRAWEKVQKKMMYMDQPEYRGQFSLYFCEANEHHGFGVGVSHFQAEIEKTDSWQPDDIILMQSTGITDKSGKEIFEGDVVRFTWANPMTYVGVVTFKQAQFFIQPADDNPPGDEYDTLHDERRIEIIGNIYENPELLPTA